MLSSTLEFEPNRTIFVKNTFFDFWTLKIFDVDNLPNFHFAENRPTFPESGFCGVLPHVNLMDDTWKKFRLNHGKIKVLISAKLHRAEAGACVGSLSFKFEPNPTTFTLAEKKPSDPGHGVSAATPSVDVTFLLEPTHFSRVRNLWRASPC